MTRRRRRPRPNLQLAEMISAIVAAAGAETELIRTTPEESDPERRDDPTAARRHQLLAPYPPRTTLQLRRAHSVRTSAPTITVSQTNLAE